MGSRRVRIAALRGDHRPPAVHRPPGRQHRGGVGVQPGQRDHLPGQRDRQLDHVRRATPGQHLDGLGDLDRVAHRHAERGGHVGEQRGVRTPARAPSSTIVLASSSGVVGPLHEGAGADLDVQHQRAGAFGDLLAHDRRGDHRDRLDGAGDVAQGVELAVRGRQIRRGRTDHRADRARVAAIISRRAERRPPAGDRLHLVERAAGVTEAAAGQLRHRGAAGRDQRRQRQRDLVPHPAGGVLVDRRPADLERSIRMPELSIAVVQCGDLGAGHAVEQDRHQQRRHLLLGDLAVGVCVDHPLDLLPRSAPGGPAWR